MNLAIFLSIAASTTAFVAPGRTSLQVSPASGYASTSAFGIRQTSSTPINKPISFTSSSTSLQMAQEDFSEAAYTESAWACIASLPKVADYYSAYSIDAPMLLDVMLNPSKHNAGDSAEAAKKVVEKILIKADVDTKVLRQELEKYFGKQPKITGSMDQQKSMGRSFAGILDRARTSKTLLGVSGCFSS